MALALNIFTGRCSTPLTYMVSQDFTRKFADTIPMKISFWQNLFTIFTGSFTVYCFEWIKSFEPALFNFILHIIFRCSEEKMVKINAGWIIALMTHKQTFRDFPVLHNPNIPVSTNSASPIPFSTISIWVNCHMPYYTTSHKTSIFRYSHLFKNKKERIAISH